MVRQLWIDGDLSTVDDLAPQQRAAVEAVLSPSLHFIVPNPVVHPRWAADVDAMLADHAMQCGYDRPDPVAVALSVTDADTDLPSILEITVSRPLDQAGAGMQAAPVPSVRTSAASRRPEVDRCTATVMAWKRNHRDPTVSTPVLGDAELAAGHRAARSTGFDRALWLNLDGRVATCDGATVVVSRDGEWLTPPLRDGALDSVWRRGLLASGGFDECPLEPEDVHAADGMWLVDRCGEVASVERFDETRFPEGTPPDVVQHWPIG